MNFKISSIFGYTSWLLKKYNELQQIQEKNIYRIIEIKQSAKEQYKLIVQVIGKSSIIECLPNEIVADDRLLEGFSQKDVRTITYLACEKIKKPKYKIVSQDFCEKFNGMVFKLKEPENEVLLTKTANQIVIDKYLINNLSKEDINSISYIAGYEYSQNKTFLTEKDIKDKTIP